MRKDWKSCKLGEIGHSVSSEPLWWEKIGKVANWAKLAILSHSEPLWWEKIGKVATQTKSNLSVGGGVHHPEPKCHIDLRSNFSIPGGGVHHPEPQCHVDTKFYLNLKNTGFLLSVFHKLEMYICNEEGAVDW